MIPAIAVDSTVVPVGAPDRVLAIPPEPWVVGWWRDGVGTGAAEGTAILVAHLDSRRYGKGPFVRAIDLRAGEAAAVTGEDGRRRQYRVAAVRTYRKEVLPYEQIFAQSGPHRVVLVTCGGEYRPDAGGWDSNVVVELEPV